MVDKDNGVNMSYLWVDNSNDILSVSFRDYGPNEKSYKETLRKNK